MHDAPPASDSPAARAHKSRVLPLIGAVRLCKAFLLVLLGTGALKLLHRDVGEQVTRWITDLGLDPGGRFVSDLIEKLGLLSDRQLKEISLGAFFYAGLMTLEGVGLLLRKTWAEYLTVIMTASLLPLEILELYHRLTPARIVVLLINLAIVVYLVWRIRHDRQQLHP